VGIGALAPVGLAGQAEPSREYQLKAAFLFNFAQFVEWPASAFTAPDAPLIIGVLGDNPFGDVLEQIVQGERVNNHPLVVEHYRRVEDIASCHILFVGEPAASHPGPVFARLRDRSVLTVSDAGDFSRHGGMIGFVTEHNHIRLQINLEAATQASLTLSSKLLRPAEIVTTVE